MLSLKPLFTVNRVTVFGDHADPDQFYYLPERIHLSTDSTGEPSFTFLKYLRDVTDNPAFSEGQQLGGGFAIFSVDLGLDDDTRRQILRQAGRFSQTTPRLVMAPFTSGTVRVVVLDSATAATATPGQVRFVENVQGTTTPSLFGDLQATFSVQLSQEGATLLEAAFAGGAQPVGVVYDLKFLGLRPAFDITVTADYKRIYDGFSAQLAGQYMMFRAEFDAGFEKLVQDQAIKVTANVYTVDADTRQQEQAALQFFKELVMKDFFSPSLPLPAQPGGSGAGAFGLPAGATQAVAGAAGAALGQVGRTVAQAAAGALAGQGQQARPALPPTAPATTRPGVANDALTRSTGVAALRTAAPANPAQRPVAPPVARPAAPATPAPATPPAVQTRGGVTPPAGPGTAGHPNPGVGAGRSGAGAPGHGTGVQAPGAHTSPQTRSATPGTPSGVPGAGAAAAGVGVGVGLTLRYMHEEELKTFTLSWNQASAEEQEHAPNGTFSALLQGLDKSRHFLAVNLDDPFFQRLKVQIECPTPFGSLGLSEVTVHLEYGDRGDGQPYFVGDVDLKPDGTGHSAPQMLTCSLDPHRALGYHYRADFFFDPSSPIRAQKTHYTTPLLDSVDRSLVIDPSTFVGFLRVDAVAGDLDFELLPRVQVRMGYDDEANAFHVEDTFVLSKEKPNFEWFVRLTDPTQRTYWYEATYFMSDNQTLVRPRQTSIDRNLVINQPWEDQLVLHLDAAMAHTTGLLAVEIAYEDPTAGYHFSFVKRIAAAADVPTNVPIPILDRSRRTYRYQVTAVNADNSVHRSGYQDGADAYLLATPPT